MDKILNEYKKMNKKELVKVVLSKVKVKAKNKEKYIYNKYTKEELIYIALRCEHDKRDIEKQFSIMYYSDLEVLAHEELGHNDYIHNMKLEGINKSYKQYLKMFTEDLEFAFMEDGYTVIDDNGIIYK